MKPIEMRETNRAAIQTQNMGHPWPQTHTNTKSYMYTTEASTSTKKMDAKKLHYQNSGGEEKGIPRLLSNRERLVQKLDKLF